jgi:hypothetical protein
MPLLQCSRIIFTKFLIGDSSFYLIWDQFHDGEMFIMGVTCFGSHVESEMRGICSHFERKEKS